MHKSCRKTVQGGDVTSRHSKVCLGSKGNEKVLLEGSLVQAVLSNTLLKPFITRMPATDMQQYNPETLANILITPFPVSIMTRLL